MEHQNENGLSVSESASRVNECSTPDCKQTSTDEGQYGWFSCNPKCLQVFNNALSFMILITVTNIFQSGTTNGLMGAAQSSIERRFLLSSTETTWIIIVYEIAYTLLSIVVTYVGTKGCHRPRWASGFLFVSVLGCLLYALPHFTTDVYLPEGEGRGTDGPTNMCRNRTGEDSNCDETEGESNLQYYIIVFILGRVGMTFGGIGLYTFSVIYLDDSVTRDKFALYTSMLALGGVIGPALGFVLGGLSLTLYTDFSSVDSKELEFDEDDPRWVGAWWLGYIIAGIGLLVTTLPITGYPRDLPGAEEMRLKKQNEASGTVTDETMNQLKIDFGLKDVPRYLKDLLTNWSFIFLTLFVCCDMAILSGFGVFGPKYAEVQFSLTAAEGGILFGALVVPAGAIGAVTGGVLVERLKLTYQRIVIIQFVISVVVSCTAFIFLVHCDQIRFAGVNVGYNSRTQIELTDVCSLECMCEDVPFSPVCSHDEVQYFSACHAGCVDYIETESTDLYNCSCISNTNSTPQATLGICSNPGCTEEVIIFSVVIFIAMVGLFMCEAMNISSTIRVVPNSHRHFGIMVEGILVRFLGTIPGPVIFASVFDAACLLWFTPCNNKGKSCFHYDNTHLGYYMMATTGCLKVGSCIFMFLAWKLYKAPPTPEESEKISDTNNSETAVTEVEDSDSAVNKNGLNGVNSVQNMLPVHNSPEHLSTRL